YVGARTVGWEEVLTAVAPWAPDRVEAASGVSVGELRRLLDALAGGAAVLLTRRGPAQRTEGGDTVTTPLHPMRRPGRSGRRASGYGCLTGQGNGQGGREHGQKADQLPGYRSITDPTDRAAVANVWGVEESDLPGAGLSAVEMLDSIGSAGGIRALLV